MARLLKNTLLSICVANFSALNMYMFFLVYNNPSVRLSSNYNALMDYLEMAELFFTIGLIISFIFTVLVGWPLYWAAIKFKISNYMSSSFAGIAVAVTPWFFTKAFGWNLPDTISYNGLAVITALGVCGVIGGITFYALEKKFL